MYESHLRNRILAVKEELYAEKKAIDERVLEQKAVQSAVIRKREKEIYERFQMAEEELAASLREQKALVVKKYGALAHEDSKFKGTVGHRWKVEWDLAPQPVQIRVEQIRGIRNKVPKGRYIVLVSLYDRLGGNPLRWSNIKGQDWFGNTTPITHGGLYDDIEMKINQSVFTVCPSRSQIRASMCLVFEVYVLKSRYVKVPSVVGWGVYPICDSKMDVLQGKFKLPLLKGRYDETIYRYFRIQDILSQDLSSWLGNLYFEMNHLSRFLRGQKEVEVQLFLTSSALGFPQHEEDGSYPGNEHDQNPAVDYTVSSYASKLVPEMQFDGRVATGFQERLKNLTKKEILDQYEFAIPQPKGIADKRRVRSKAKYLWSELQNELDFDLWYTPGFWLSFLFLAITMYSRLFVHYLGQRFFLTSEGIPVGRFEYTPYTVHLDYMEEDIPTQYTLGLIAAGVITNILLFICFALVSWASQIILGSFYPTLSKFILFYGIATFFDPLLILLVDVISGNTERGDAFKLNRVMEANDGDGMAGIFLTIFLYSVLMCCTALLVLAYFHKLHGNGRVYDVLHRITATPEDLFMPEDHEVSYEDIEHIIENTERWRGPNGERRKIVCFDYKTYGAEPTSDNPPDPLEVSTHLAIYELSTTGQPKVYRHFLRHPEGTIVELFESVESLLSNTPNLARAVQRDRQGNNVSAFLNRGGLVNRNESPAAGGPSADVQPEIGE
eukprot:TRINITY_DN1981_c0_g1_i2.p1 TRINITY_DN1981_c0_g1~~TRINITY_DN1981_c0_g1_i2.p1  ORF type:complete len:724 (-),score=115.89 TRINITY_DN1981_c0_g1_i2:133-2304(-)